MSVGTETLEKKPGTVQLSRNIAETAYLKQLSQQKWANAIYVVHGCARDLTAKPQAQDCCANELVISESLPSVSAEGKVSNSVLYATPLPILG